MTEQVLIDTGPLVALFCADDPHHNNCVTQFDKLHSPPLVTWPVLTEAAWLLRKTPDAVEQLLCFVEQGLLHVSSLDATAATWIRNFMRRFGDSRPDLADATLVYLAERLGIVSVFTIDRRDFAIYRTSDGRALRIIPGL